jgi:hypothetical protein
MLLRRANRARRLTTSERSSSAVPQASACFELPALALRFRSLPRSEAAFDDVAGNELPGQARTQPADGVAPALPWGGARRLINLSSDLQHHSVSSHVLLLAAPERLQSMHWWSSPLPPLQRNPRQRLREAARRESALLSRPGKAYASREAASLSRSLSSPSSLARATSAFSFCCRSLLYALRSALCASM